MTSEGSVPHSRRWGAVVSVAAITSLIISLLARSFLPVFSDASRETDYRLIQNRGTIRCGYVSNPPSCIINPNTGQVSGIFVEAFEAAAKNLGLKVEWTEEVGFGSMIEGLRNKRYDAVPCAIWPTAARAREADFTDPLFYSPVGVYVRKGDTRFLNNLSLINSADVKIATIDGEMAAVIARADFPSAERVELPQLSEISTMLLNVKEGKADVTFVELYFAEQFLKNNPGSIENIASNRPLRVFPNTVMLRSDQAALKAMLNTALRELVNLGTVDRLLTKYEPAPGTFYRIERAYRQSEKP